MTATTDARRSRTAARPRERGILSSFDWRRPRIFVGWRAMHVVLMIGLVALGAIPLLWMLRAAISSTTDLLQHPLSLVPSPAKWENIPDAWNLLSIGQYLGNTVVLVGGSWIVQLVISATAGFALAVIPPRYRRIV